MSKADEKRVEKVEGRGGRGNKEERKKGKEDNYLRGSCLSSHFSSCLIPSPLWGPAKLPVLNFYENAVSFQQASHFICVIFGRFLSLALKHQDINSQNIRLRCSLYSVTLSSPELWNLLLFPDPVPSKKRSQFPWGLMAGTNHTINVYRSLEGDIGSHVLQTLEFTEEGTNVQPDTVVFLRSNNSIAPETELVQNLPKCKIDHFSHV